MKNRFLFILLFFFAIRVSVFAEYSDHRNRHVDSLEMVLQSGIHLSDDDSIRIYKDLMWGYLQTDGGRATEYARRVVRLARKHDYYNSECDGLRIMGLVAYGGGDYDRALEFFNDALAATERMRGRYKDSDVDDNLSALYGSIGNLYNMQDKLLLAIEYYQKALPIFEKYGWKESTTILYHNVAELYCSMGNGDEALRNYYKSLEWSWLTNDSGLIALPHKGLALYYVSAHQYDSALVYLPYAYKYYADNKDLENESYVECVVAKGSVALNKDSDVPVAWDYANEALSRINDDTGAEQVSAVYALLCELSMRNSDWHQALRFAQKAVEVDGEETYDDIGIFVWMAQIYTELGDTKNAKRCIVKVYNQMQEFATLHYQSGLSEMEVKYDTEKKQMQIDTLESERRWILIISIMAAVILISLLLLFLFLWRSVSLQRHNAVVQAKLEGEIAERVRISRDLHDRLGGLLTAIRLSLPTDTKALALTDEAIHEMRNVSHHLLPYSLKHYGLKAALSDYCSVLSNVSFEYRGAEKRIQNEDAIYCIVYELINNALKNAEAKRIGVVMEMNESEMIIIVEDDGKGFDPSAESAGMGLLIVRERVEALGGSLTIKSEAGRGTEVRVMIKQ